MRLTLLGFSEGMGGLPGLVPRTTDSARRVGGGAHASAILSKIK